MRHPIALLFAAAFLACQAHAQVSEAEREILIEFHESTGGDQWDYNDGWLGPEGTECDWSGVWCSEEDIGPTVTRLGFGANNMRGTLPESIGALPYLRDLFLQGNRLEGELPEAVFDNPNGTLSRVDLSRNRFTGTVPAQALYQARMYMLLDDNRFEELPDFDPPPDVQVASRIETTTITINNNELSGPIPDFIGELASVRVLELANNRLSGPLPESMANLSLSKLHLQNNRLAGDIAPAVLAIEPGLHSGPAWQIPRLLLSDNRFEGPIPGELLSRDHLIPRNVGRYSGGLDFCWNDLEFPDDPEMVAFVDERHRGGFDADCLGTDREMLDKTASGTWFDPARSGEGLTQMLLDNGDFLVYSFTYDEAGGQRWQFGNGASQGAFVDWFDFFETRDGSFGQGTEPGHQFNRGSMRIDRIEDRKQWVVHGRYDFPDFVIDPPPHFGFQVEPDNRVFGVEQVQLSRLAGSTCDNAHDNQWISGLWFDPERSGEGFVVEVIEDGRGLVYWFTYSPDDSGNQAWMMGDGEFEGSTLHIENLIQPVGATYGEDFDPADVDRLPWGSLTLEFIDNESGHVSWDSAIEEFGAGDYPLRRLAQARLAECEAKP